MRDSNLLAEALKTWSQEGAIALCESTISFGHRSVCKHSNTYFEYHKNRIRKKCKKDTDADPMKVLYISPDEITYVTGDVKREATSSHLEKIDNFPQGLETLGNVVGGDWDSRNYKFNQLEIFKAFRQRYVKGLNWGETDFYHLHKCRIEERGKSYNCSTLEDLENKLDRNDMIFEKIEQKGYKTQKEIGTCSPLKEINVNIGRDGTFLFNGGGRHRLSIAKILDLNKVPVIVRVRHKKWQSVRNKISNKIINNYVENHHYLDRPHPDLRDLK